MLGTKRSLPLVYGAAALLMVLVALPSALRPPPDEASASAEFSADAPPEDDPDVIIQTLEQARSRTPGGLSTDEPDEIATTTTQPPPEKVLTRGGCIGKPPKQIESPYAAPCVEIFQGDNGGATSKGVDANEIRVIIWQHNDGGDGHGYTGRVPDEPQPGESAEARTTRVYQKFFNDNYEFYGRKLQLIVDPQPGNGDGPAPNRAHVAETDEAYGGLFGAYTDYSVSMIAGLERGIVSIGGFQLEHHFYDDHRPYLLSWNMDGSQLVRINTEYICKRLAPFTAKWAGDAAYHVLPRKFGLLYSEFQGSTGFTDLPEMVKQRCGAEILMREVGFVGADEGQSASAVAAFKLEGVTTVMMATDPISPAVVTAIADGQAYYPEWYIPGMWQLDEPAVPGLFSYSKNQWRNAFGISPREFRVDDKETDWYRAYKSIDPAGEANATHGSLLFPILVQFANGIQEAGPNLTPETFHQALLNMPKRTPEPPEFYCCGFTSTNLSYSDMVNEIYYVEDGTSPNCDICTGTYIYPECGTRYGEGQIPDGEPGMFGGGCRLPRDGRAYPASER